MVKKLGLYIFLTILFCLTPAVASAHDTLPAGFEKTSLVSGLSQPTDFAQTPDGRFFILEKGGTIKIVKNGVLLPTPLLTLPVDSEGEKGLLGIALDPSFSANGYIYLYYVNASPKQIRVSRFVVSADSAVSEKILLTSTQALNLAHHSGTVRVGPDGKLWISVGNNSNNANSQDLTNIHGKLLRINRDGTIPTDNPFVGSTSKRGEIWAYGFRNPFRFTFLPSGLPMVGDVGEATFEEINLVQKGGNYGWPNAEGPCSSCSSINPFFYYAHNGATASITGGVSYKQTGTTPFPSSYTNAFFYGDYALGFIKYLSLDQNGNFLSDNEFDDHAGTVVSMQQGADGSLYFLNIYPGELQKISYVGGNVAPTVKLSASPTAGKAPLSVQFSSDGSEDPEGKPLTYSWNFGDGSPLSSEANPTHIYAQNGTYTAALTVSDGEKQSSLISFPITVGKTPPQITVNSPVAESKYNAGDTISYSATATDEADGTLPASAYSWTIQLHHQTHVHPFLGPITNAKSGTFRIPDTGEPSSETWYEIVLTVTNSQGLQTTSKTAIYPNVVTMTFGSNPTSGLGFTLDGIPVATPYTIKGVVGFKRVLDVPTPQLVGNTSYDFTFWSQGGNKQQTVVTPTADTTYTLNFNEAGSGTGHMHFRVREFDKNGNWTGNFVNGATAKLTDPTGETVYDTQTSKTVNGQDGWVYFDYQQVGTYSVLTYQSGYTGFWKQTTCAGAGTTQNVTIQNKNTSSFVAALAANIKITQNQITWCTDVGLKVASTGNLFFRIRQVEKDTQTQSPDAPYIATGDINGATVKLTNKAGDTVIMTTTSVASPNGEAGWAFFKDVPAGDYGIMAYKDGYKGFWKQIDCISYENDAKIQNANTDGNIAAWNGNVTVQGGITNYCRDLGLTASGHWHFRVREMDGNGVWTGKFVNGATAKLTDPTGATVYATTTSKTINGQDGWVYFDFIESGKYSTLVYTTGYTGYWKQTDCDTGGTTANATIQNANTAGLVAAMQAAIPVKANTVTWCTDVGLKNNTLSPTGHIHLRVRDMDSAGNLTGKFVNGATAKLTDTNGNIVYSNVSSQVITGQDGWVYFDFVPVGNYAVLVYKAGSTGFWKQTDCTTGGTTSGATIQNANTEGNTAAWQNTLTVKADTITWCADVGLKSGTSSPAAGRAQLRIREFDASGNWTGKFINGATVKLTDTTGATVVATGTSAVLNGEDGWVYFDAPAGNYGVLAYKAGLSGFWKQADCAGNDTTTNATIQNGNTEGNTAAWDNLVEITAGQTRWCQDLGLKMATAATGRLAVRIREMDGNGVWTGKFINGATVKLTDTSGNTVTATLQSETRNSNEEGWAFFEAIPAGNYGILSYKDGYTGVWKQTDCDTGGTTANATIQNTNTANNTAAWQDSVSIVAAQTTWCKDLGLRPNGAVAAQQAAIQSSPTSTPTPTQAVIEVKSTPAPVSSASGETSK